MVYKWLNRHPTDLLSMFVACVEAVQTQRIDQSAHSAMLPRYHFTGFSVSKIDSKQTRCRFNPLLTINRNIFIFRPV